jgi:hypothetical protein
MTMEYVLLAVAGVGVVLTLTLPSLRAVVMMMIAVGLVSRAARLVGCCGCMEAGGARQYATARHVGGRKPLTADR